MGENERQHLVAWSKAIKKIGKGKGKYAEHHRRTARQHMKECRRAIPAWIMPLHRVVESIQPGKDRIDVAIIDEASQSGPEALLLYFIADKVVVVGDDKQISPDFVGVNREDVIRLRKQHIPDLPHNETFSADYSFFEDAEIRFGGRIRLREHFRCMPEIIQFSNNHYYLDDPLIPVRQFAGDRLEPVKVTYIKEGYREGEGRRIVNPPESTAIAEEIANCLSDPKYDEKTFGVISLQGDDQARLIEQELIKTVGPETIEEREIVCGNAYAFQGDERDVMFLSLVAAPNARIGALTRADAEKRFNVAASRAKDQMWLFHSVALSDLSPDCQRHKLLKYLTHPSVEPVLHSSLVPEDRLVEPFDSLLEQRVHNRIVSKGYRVIPQYEMAGKYIDLMVEGMRGRLAVECDGEHWHGPEEYEKDTARQRQLERCGLKFVRIRESSFYRDTNAALEDLWSTLDRLQISPTNGIAIGESESSQAIDVVKKSPTLADDFVPTKPPSDLPPKPKEYEETAPVEPASKEPSEKVEEQEDGSLAVEPSNLEFEKAKAEEEEDQHSDIGPDSPTISTPIAAANNRGLYRAVNPVDAVDQLDSEAFYSNSYNPTLRSMIDYVVQHEGPIQDDLLAKRVARAHGFERTGRAIKDRVKKLTAHQYKKSRDRGSTFIWPEGTDPETWDEFRAPESKDDYRRPEEIVSQELAVLARKAIVSSPDDPAHYMSKQLGLARLTAPTRRYLESFIEDTMSKSDEADEGFGEIQESESPSEEESANSPQDIPACAQDDDDIASEELLDNKIPVTVTYQDGTQSVGSIIGYTTDRRPIIQFDSGKCLRPMPGSVEIKEIESGQETISANSEGLTDLAARQILIEPDFTIGQRVFHHEFGYGTITAINGPKLDIRFDKAGPKKVMARFVEGA